MMLKNLRWLAPMGLICAAGTAHAAEVRMVVQNESDRPWRLRCLQATPSLKVDRTLMYVGRLPGENRSYQVDDEIRVGGRQRVEIRLSDTDATGPLRFALLHGLMEEPDGTTLTFTWDWKGASNTESVALEHRHEADQQLRENRRLAVRAEANVCTIRWGSFTDPQGRAEAAAGAGAGSGSGSGSAAEVGLPAGSAGKGPMGGVAGAAQRATPRPLSITELVSAGAGAGSGSGLPTGPSTTQVLPRLSWEVQQMERARQARVESKAPEASAAPQEPETPLEPELYTAGDRVKVRTREVTNRSSHPYNLALRQAADASSYTLEGPDGAAAGSLDEVVMLPADSQAKLTTVTESPRKAVVVLERADGTPGKAAERTEVQLGTPSRIGGSPLKLRQVKGDGKADAAPRTYVRAAGPDALEIQDYDSKAGVELDELLTSLAPDGPDTAPSARSQAPAAQEPDVASLPSAGDPLAQTAAGATAAVESKQAATPAAGAGAPGRETRIPFTGLPLTFPALGRDSLPTLDLEQVTGDDKSAQDAVWWFLYDQSRDWEDFNQASQDYAKLLDDAVFKAGSQEWGKTRIEPALLQVVARYRSEGEERVKAALDECLGEWEKSSKVKRPWTLPPLRTRLHALGDAWLRARVRETLKDILKNLPDATGSGEAGAGTGAGAGAGSSSQGGGSSKA